MARRSISLAATGPCARASRRSATAAAVRPAPDGFGKSALLLPLMEGTTAMALAWAPLPFAVTPTGALGTAFNTGATWSAESSVSGAFVCDRCSRSMLSSICRAICNACAWPISTPSRIQPPNFVAAVLHGTQNLIPIATDSDGECRGQLTRKMLWGETGSADHRHQSWSPKKCRDEAFLRDFESSPAEMRSKCWQGGARTPRKGVRPRAVTLAAGLG